MVVAGAFAGEVLADRTSDFGRVQVVEVGGVRELLVDGSRQSAFDSRHPKRLVYVYSQLMAASLCSWAALGAPGEVLVVGLGGGTLSRHLDTTHPQLSVTAVELDPVVVRLARRFFALPTEVRVVVGDGRAYLEQTDRRWDLIVLDAASEDYIPPALMTREFYRLVQSRLADRGVVIANAWAQSPTAAHEAATWTSVWDPAYQLTGVDEGVENRVLMGGYLPSSWRDLRRRMTSVCGDEEGFDIEALRDGLEVLTPEGGNVLTDPR